MDNEEQLRRYRELMGSEAAARQEKLKRETCSYCGGRDGEHSPACKRQWTGRKKT